MLKRAIFFAIAAVQLLHNSGTEVGRRLNIGSFSITRSIPKGKLMINANAYVGLHL